jgi:ketosteroid isomerase-like protein
MPHYRDERLALRFPGLYERLVRRAMALPVGSRLRQKVLKRVASRMFEAFSRGDAEAFLLSFDPEVEIHFIGAEALGLAGHYQGHEGVRAWIRDWHSQWGDYDEVVEQLVDLGDSVITRSKISARGERSGLELTRTAGNHVHLSDGRITRWDGYFDWSDLVAAEALEDVAQPAASTQARPTSSAIT